MTTPYRNVERIRRLSSVTYILFLAAFLLVAMAASFGAMLALPLSAAAQGNPSAARSFSPAAIFRGGQVTVNVTAANYGGSGAVTETWPAGFTYVSSSLSDDQVSVTAFETRFTLTGDTSFTYTLTVPVEEGSYTFSGTLRDSEGNDHALGGAAAVNVTAGDPLIARYDANGNGRIDRSEVIAAIDDYFSGEGEPPITRAEVSKLIDLYRAALAHTSVTAIHTYEGVLVNWDNDGAAYHWIAWINRGDYNDAIAAGQDWQESIHYAVTAAEGSYVIKHLPEGKDYRIRVGAASDRTLAGAVWSGWFPIADAPPLNADEVLTRKYVMDAIAYYDGQGREATVAHYNTEASVQDGRVLILVDTTDDNRLLAYGDNPALVGESVTGRISLFLPIGEIIKSATVTGTWTTMPGINGFTGERQSLRFFAVLRQDGLVFISSHRDLTDDIRDTVKEYVNRAIKYYDANGKDATVARYNSSASREGQLYLFLIGADDNYLAHPIFPHLIGTDIKAVEGSDGDPLGKRIAQATEEGIWVKYLWPHPVSRKELPKVTWVIRHDGLIFASGYYIGGSERSEFKPPAWAKVADPRQYTQDYVERAIKHYKEHGLESLKRYYNSSAAYEGQWYLFATDANDIYIVHPLITRLIGTDIKDVVGDDGFELGKALAAAQDGGAGVWVEYDWPHPLTLKKVPKEGYAKRYDGILFASGYYPVPNLVAQSKTYVQEAIEYYDANGLDATIVKYDNPDSIGGHLSAMIIDEQGIVRVFSLQPNLKGIPVSFLVSPTGQKVGEEFLKATEDGIWVSFYFPTVGASGSDYQHGWLRRHDGLIFGVGYSDDQPDVPATAKTDNQLTREYVMNAVAYYDDNGRDATVAHYLSDASVANGRSLTLLDANTSVLLVYHTIRTLQGQYVGPGSTFAGFQALLASATAEGQWITSRAVNPVTKQEEPRRIFFILHGGLVFVSSHSVLVEDVAQSTKEYVNRAIKYYDANGKDATVARYNSRASLDGQFYLFLIGADDNYLAHPIFPHLIGTDIKDVKDSAGYELGKEIAKATQAGHWVKYLWPHPVTRKELPKVAWVIRHDGLIFASGYYTGGSQTDVPPWQNVADPREYTVQYVNRAVKRYEDNGLESMLNYYNSVASFEGQWYLFATDANDVYHVHPLLPHLIGTDIKKVVGVDGYQLGRALAAAEDGGEGVWVEYLWDHPVTLQKVPKVGYAVRKDGMLFASGYYPQVADPAGYTQAYVQKAIDYYKANGLDATVAHYENRDSVDPKSVDGQWNLTLADANDKVLVAILSPGLVGKDLKTLGAGRTRQIGREMAAATTDGIWINVIWPNTRSSETLYAHIWAIRYDGLLFSARYYDGRPGNPPE